VVVLFVEAVSVIAVMFALPYAMRSTWPLPLSDLPMGISSSPGAAFAVRVPRLAPGRDWPPGLLPLPPLPPSKRSDWSSARTPASVSARPRSVLSRRSRSSAAGVVGRDDRAHHPVVIEREAHVDAAHVARVEPDQQVALRLTVRPAARIERAGDGDADVGAETPLAHRHGRLGRSIGQRGVASGRAFQRLREQRGGKVRLGRCGRGLGGSVRRDHGGGMGAACRCGLGRS
jgi:hypothetical protein